MPNILRKIVPPFFLLALLSGCNLVYVNPNNSSMISVWSSTYFDKGYPSASVRAQEYCTKEFSKPAVYTGNKVGCFGCDGGAVNSYFFTCATVYSQPAEEPKQQVTEQINPKESKKPQDAKDAAKRNCSELGFKPGTKDFGNCVLKLIE
jgi:hypothetical protein